MSIMSGLGCGETEVNPVIGDINADTSIDFLASLTPRFQLIMGGKSEETPYGSIPAQSGFTAFLPKNLFILIVILLIIYLLRRIG